MEAPEQQQPQRSTTNAYPQIKRELARDTDLRMETREAIARMDFSADSLTRQYSKLLEDTDLTKEARERKAAEAHSYFAPRINNERGRAKELLLADADKLERAALPKPKGSQMHTDDPTRLLLVQGESDRLRRLAEKRSSNPVFKSAGIIDFFKREYKKGLSEGGTQGEVRCMAVLRNAEEEGISTEEIVNSLRTEEQQEKAHKAYQLRQFATWSISTQASSVPRSLQGPRRYSRRPEQRREGGAAVFVPNLRASEPVYKHEAGHVNTGGASDEATSALPEQGVKRTLPAKGRKKKQWK